MGPSHLLIDCVLAVTPPMAQSNREDAVWQRLKTHTQNAKAALIDNAAFDMTVLFPPSSKMPGVFPGPAGNGRRCDYRLAMPGLPLSLADLFKCVTLYQ